MGSTIADHIKANRTSSCVETHTQVEICEPVWLFSDDLQELIRVLERLGEIRISTDKVVLDDPSEALEKLPLRSLCLSAPEVDLSVLILPQQLEVRWSHEWNPSARGVDVVRRIREFVAVHRHPLFILGKRGWQATGGLIAFALLLPTVVSYLLYGQAHDVAVLATVAALPLGTLVGLLALIGCFVPDRSHLTLWKCTRAEFLQSTRKGVRYLLGGTTAFLLGVLVGGRGWIAILPLFALLGLIILLAVGMWWLGPPSTEK